MKTLTVENPPEEDSEDFSEEEAASATVTTSLKELAGLLIESVKEFGDGPRQHSLLRKNKTLYWRAKFKTPEGDKSLVFQTNWIGL